MTPALPDTRLNRRAGWAGVIIALLALAGVWRFMPPTTPAIYDGACGSQDYRYVSPPAGSPATPKPDPVSKNLTLVNHLQPTTELVTDEAEGDATKAPQAQLIVTEDTFTAPPEATSMTLSIEPMAAPATQPTDGTLESNVYRFRATVDSKDVPQTTPGTIVLLATQVDSSDHAIEQFSNGSWKRINPTVPISCGASFGASVRSLGDFAVVKLGTTAAPATPPDSSAPPLLAAGGALVAIGVLGGVVYLLRRRQART